MKKLFLKKVDLKVNNFKAEYNPKKFISDSEDDYCREIRRIAGKVIEKLDRKSIMMICGPSASGKTTTANKMQEELAKNGIKAPVISLDDFYMSADKIPKLPDGKPDYESIYGLDLALLERCLSELFEKGEADFPVYNFNTHAGSEKNRLSIGKNDILIIEGIHALNPLISKNLDEDKFMRVYIEARTEYWDGDTKVLTAMDTRMIRRMVRDYYYRGSSLDNTLDMWVNVMEGEKKYIRPYIPLADHVVNTAHDYEPNIFHNYLLPLLLKEKESRYEDVYRRLVKALELFYDIPKEYMPKDTMLREFIEHS